MGTTPENISYDGTPPQTSSSIDPLDGSFANEITIPTTLEDQDQRFISSLSDESTPIVTVPEDWERRPSFLGFGAVYTGSALRHSKENDRLLNFVEKYPRIQMVKEMRTQKLIGNIGSFFDWGSSYKDKDDLDLIKSKKLKNFYQNQNSLIEKFEEVDKLLDSGIHHKMIRNYSERNDGDYITSRPTSTYGVSNNEDHDDNSPTSPISHRRESAVPGNVDLETGNLLGYNKEDEIALVKLAILVNFIANVVLLLGKAIVAFLTSSISIVASLVDSALDFLSTLIIFFSNQSAQSKNSKNFPIGKNRLEPIGVLVFSIIIILSFGQVGIEAFNRLLHDKDKEIVEIGINSTLIMILTIVVKFGCYIWGRTIKSSSAEALAQDALADVIFNSFSILMPFVGYKFQIYWFDPLGALLLSIYIIWLWSITSFEHIIHLTGLKADPDDYKVILYLCSRFAEKIVKIKDINCYHVGDSINVEVDLVLDYKNLSIKDSHDLAEALQYTLEALPSVNVERAFVHIDYKVDNFKGHLRG